MAEVRIGKELSITTANQVGMLEKISSQIAQEGVNIRAICAYAQGSEANFMIVLDGKEESVEKAMQDKGYQVKVNEVVLLPLADQVGKLSGVGKKLAEANIDLEYIYGTTCGCGDEDCNCDALIVCSSNDNQKTVEVLR